MIIYRTRYMVHGTQLRLLLTLILLQLCTTYYVLLSPHALASTDPQTATVSATARVPSSAPTTGDTTAPPAVILISPHDGATTNQSRPELVWKATFDSNSNNVTYTVYQNGVATYLGISNTGNSQQNNYISHLGDGNIYLTPTLDLAPGIYDWYVRATDGSNNASFSTTWRFTIDQTPPPLTVVNIDDVYLIPTIIEGTILDLPGPQEIKIVFATESYATISITYTLVDGTITSLSLPTDNSGLATHYFDLPLGKHQFIVSSFDSAGLTTVHPTFYLNLTNVAVPGISVAQALPIINSILKLPSQILSYPATISQIKDAQVFAYGYYSLLAMALLALLIFIWKRRYNITIIDPATNKPYRSLIIYHSRPTRSARLSSATTRLYVTNRIPVLYEVGRSGRTYIRRLGQFSSLTIRTPAGVTHILSISRAQKKYLIIV